ncbi:CBS domain-containing protein [Methanobrevibacter arboriphilus]|uniref:CBS domain-containing protein n=1 Tax=Methanobrevibacter arboriphilus TaxID=39441 RepID=UPI0022EFAD3C|nr:CBS domain-containing protein [Methanobrevibacter arboriphilus]GLI12469.1 CBS domain-containing protein [Methanobrevibacter arboriphilus]
MLKNKKVSEVMTKNVFTTNPDEDVVFAFEKLMKNKVSALPVLDEDGKMIGIVTASDLGYNLILDNYKLGTKVSSVMVKNVTSVSPEESLYDAICTMEENAPGGSIVNQLPVLENGTLVGIIYDGDIIKALK